MMEDYDSGGDDDHCVLLLLSMILILMMMVMMMSITMLMMTMVVLMMMMMCCRWLLWCLWFDCNLNWCSISPYCIINSTIYIINTSSTLTIFFTHMKIFRISVIKNDYFVVPRQLEHLLLVLVWRFSISEILKQFCVIQE